MILEKPMEISNFAGVFYKRITILKQKMDSDRISVYRYLPDGRYSIVRPFHISLEGLETALICKDEEDYDVMVKNIFLAARRANVVVIIYAVVSNHAHIAILAMERNDAEKFGNDLKKVQSMWLHKKYKTCKALLDCDVDVSEINSLRYARNALAYIPRNAMDNGADNIAGYKWTGFRGMFCKGKCSGQGTLARNLTTREKRRILHTGDKLADVPWILNQDGEIEPASACDWQYLESIFNHDQAYFVRTVGDVNTADMKYRLEESKHTRLNDEAFLNHANKMSVRWYGSPISSLTQEDKSRMLYYLTKTVRCSIPQISRCLGMDRELVAKLLRR